MAAKKKIVSPIRKVRKGDPPQQFEQPEVDEQEYVEVETEEQFKDFKEYLNVFQFTCVLPGSGETIKFKPLTVAALKKILSYEGDIGNAEVITAMFDDLFRICVLNDGFDPHDLFVFDRYALLLEIRKRTKGETSDFDYTCEKCKSQSIQSIDYEDIEMLPVPEDIDYIVQLTEDISVKMQYITRREELEVFRIVKQETKGMKPNEKEAESAIFLEASTIAEIITPQGPQEGLTIYDKKFLLDQLPQPLYNKVGKWHEKYKFGPNLEISIECPHCNHKVEEIVTNFNFF